MWNMAVFSTETQQWCWKAESQGWICPWWIELCQRVSGGLRPVCLFSWVREKGKVFPLSSVPLCYRWLFATGDDATVEERCANLHTVYVTHSQLHTLSHLGKRNLPFLFTSPHLLWLLLPTSTTLAKVFMKMLKRSTTSVFEESVNRPWSLWTKWTNGTVITKAPGLRHGCSDIKLKWSLRNYTHCKNNAVLAICTHAVINSDAHRTHTHVHVGFLFISHTHTQAADET